MFGSMLDQWWRGEARELRDRVRELDTEVMRLKNYESTVKFIACDYIELSYEKAQWQRDDWRKRCVKTIEEAPIEWTENYGQGSEPWLKDEKK